jgi:hypothetical protein
MARKVRPSAEEIDRELRHKLVKIAQLKSKSAYHREMASLAEAFIDYIDVKHRVLPRDYPIDIKVKL